MSGGGAGSASRAAVRYCTDSANTAAARSAVGTVRCSADSASMDPALDAEAESACRSVESASMDPVPDSEAESVRHSADSASTDSVQNSEAESVRHSGVDSADPAVPDLDSAEHFRRCVDSDLRPVFPGSYLYIQMNSDLRNLP